MRKNQPSAATPTLPSPSHSGTSVARSAAALVMAACAGKGSFASQARPERPPLASTPAAQGFRHPGVLLSAPMIDFVRAKVSAGQEPWRTAFLVAERSPYGDLAYRPHPRAVVACGPSSHPDEGCTDERRDAAAAYTHALLWSYAGDRRHADKAAEILAAWSSTLTAHTLSNAPLQAAWVAELLPRAADLLRASDPYGSETARDQLAAWMKRVFLPLIAGGSSANGNWELSMIDALMALAVFSDDGPLFTRAVAMWRARVPAYVYLTADGSPVSPPWPEKDLGAFWHRPAAWRDGLTQETCRDAGHVQYGLAAMVAAGETAALQGVPLLVEQGARLRSAWELLARLRENPSLAVALCGRSVDTTTREPTGDLALDVLSVEPNQPMPALTRVLAGARPLGVSHHMVWETLTHVGVDVSMKR